MPKIILLTPCPNEVVSKAILLLDKPDELLVRSKKIASLPVWRSIRLGQGYRLLFYPMNWAYLANHDIYERQIKNLKRRALGFSAIRPATNVLGQGA